jgi:hypothetical protein
MSMAWPAKSVNLQCHLLTLKRPTTENLIRYAGKWVAVNELAVKFTTLSNRNKTGYTKFQGLHRQIRFCLLLKKFRQDLGVKKHVWFKIFAWPQCWFWRVGRWMDGWE